MSCLPTRPFHAIPSPCPSRSPIAMLLILATLLCTALLPGSARAERVDPDPRLAPTIVETPLEPLNDARFLRWFQARRAEASQGALQDDPFTIIDGCVAEDMARVDAPGASIAILHHGELIYRKGYGVKHAQQGGEIDADTLFRIGSVTKMMTAAAVMQLVEEGTLDLHAPITDVLPDFRIAPPWKASDITLQHLLTHSAGIPDNLEGAFDPTTLAEWAGRQAGLQLYAPPGSFYNYSNPSWSLAGLAVQAASGQGYRDRITERVWRPAGMPLTTFDADAVVTHGNFAYGHVPGRELAPDDYDSLWGGPAGFAFSTPTELVTWAKLLMDGGGQVLTPASAEAMQAAQIDRHAQPGQSYGYGITRNDQWPEVTLLGHGGNIDGYSASLYWIPEEDFAAALVATSSASLDNAMPCAVLTILQPDLPEPDDLTTDPGTWSRYAGTYVVQDRYGSEETLWVEADGSSLTAHRSDESVPMVQAYLDTFVEDRDGDGQGDGDAVTLIEDPARPGRAQWVRNRGFVGIRAGDFPRQVSIEGSGCQAVELDVQMAMPALEPRAVGLENQVEETSDLPIEQDDPEDPTSAGHKQALRLDEAAGSLSIDLTGEAEDDLDLFLLRDQNGDGRFDLETEEVGRSTTPTALESIHLGGVEPVPAGDYQIWVQGWRVEGEDSRFGLRIEQLAGDALTVAGAPSSVAEGEPLRIELCVDAASMRVVDEPRRGLLVLGTGAAPRHILLPVTWQPDAAPPTPPAIYLPALLRAAGFSRR